MRDGALERPSSRTWQRDVTLGANPLTFTISDGVRSASDGVVIRLEDTVAPAIASAAASPSVLWPPNHKMVPVTVTAGPVTIGGPR